MTVINLEEMLAAIRELEPEIAIVKVSALMTKCGKPNKNAIDLVRALIVHSKFTILYLHTDPTVENSEIIQWLGENVYKKTSFSVLRNMIGGNIMCATNWKQVLTHDKMVGEPKLAIVDTFKDVETLYKNTNIQPIYLPRRSSDGTKTN